VPKELLDMIQAARQGKWHYSHYTCNPFIFSEHGGKKKCIFDETGLSFVWVLWKPQGRIFRRVGRGE
jgi:hypothetical protein